MSFFIASEDIRRALRLVGALLAAEGHEYAITVLGGAALNMLGIVARTTSDVDVIAFATPSGSAAPLIETLRRPDDPLPLPLLNAARAVAEDLELDPDWLNAKPADQWRFGLPDGMGSRLRWERYGGLWVGLVDRYDLIFFKLFAAVDRASEGHRDMDDLVALDPSDEELEAARTWVLSQDAGEVFPELLDGAMRRLRRELRRG